MLTLARLKQLLIYNPKTGMFRHRISRGRVSAMSVAGAKDKYGYILIGIDGKTYLAHHLAWFYVHGVWPDELDHENKNRSYNAIGNLREATRQQNQVHRKLPVNNTSGYKGVIKTKYGKYTAQTKLKRKGIHIGTFDTPELAAEAYNTYMKNLHGDFFIPQKIKPSKNNTATS